MESKDLKKICDQEIYDILNARAIKRGFVSLKDAIDYLNKNDLQALYVIVKEYNFDDIWKGINTILEKNISELDFWYRKCWTKTVVLAGNPQKVSSRFPFKYYSGSLGLIGPIYQSEKIAKQLTMNYFVPLETAPLNLKRFQEKASKNFKFIFKDVDLGLGKFIVQLVHMLAEIGIEKQRVLEKPSIEVSNKDIKNEYSYKYLRIDGGGGGLRPFTLTATAILR